jgi:phosphoserine phosphatase
VRKHTRMAIAYDFDGTLAAGNIQEHQFLPNIGLKPQAFWKEVKRITKQHQADEVAVYMSLMLKKAAAAEVPVRREDFKSRGRAIKLFEGVETWFDRVSEYARQQDVRLEHYLISSGNAEIFAGTTTASKFIQVYASKYMFNENGVADWPALVINYTTKTQFLFRINKGTHDLSDNSEVNKYIEKKDRAIPFENMIFIGDGSTDIPCFRVVKEQGGLSIGVYQPHTKGARTRAGRFLKDGRTHCITPANYSEGSDLDNIVKDQIRLVSARAGVASRLSEYSSGVL